MYTRHFFVSTVNDDKGMTKVWKYRDKVNNLVRDYSLTTNDYRSCFTISNMSETVGKKLLDHNVDFEKFDDFDFLKLSSTIGDLVPTMSNSKFDYIVNSMEPAKIGRFFVIFIEKCISIWNAYIAALDLNENDRKTNQISYGRWMRESEDERYAILDNFVKTVVRYPETPIEILGELI